MSIVPYHLRSLASIYLLAVFLIMGWLLCSSLAHRLVGRAFAVSSEAMLLALLLLAFGVLLKVLGRLCVRRKLREHMVSARASIDSGKNFALLLYPFDTRARPTIDVLWGNFAIAWLLGRRWNVEELLVAATGQLHPYVALGRQEGIAGAAKIPSTDTDWESKVKDLARKASVIVFFPGPGKGLSWEIDHILSDESLASKCLFIRVSVPLTFTEHIRAKLHRLHGKPLTTQIGLGHPPPLSANMWPMLVDGCYFFERSRSSNAKLELLYLPLMNCNPGHLLSLMMSIAFFRLPGFRSKLLSQRNLKALSWNEDGADVIADHSLRDIRNARVYLGTYEVIRAMDAVFFLVVCTTWWLRL